MRVQQERRANQGNSIQYFDEIMVRVYRPSRSKSQLDPWGILERQFWRCNRCWKRYRKTQYRTDP